MGVTLRGELPPSRCEQRDDLCAVHVASVEALTAREERVHGGHFGSDKRVNAVEDGGQVGKLQFLEGQAERGERGNTGYCAGTVAPGAKQGGSSL